MVSKLMGRMSWRSAVGSEHTDKSYACVCSAGTMFQLFVYPDQTWVRQHMVIEQGTR
jgi:hypothetical protein